MLNGPVEVISCDSRQIYKGLEIGSAAPTAEEIALIPHHLISFLPPDQTYTAGKFIEDADLCEKEILMRGKIPILAGGAGFYFHAYKTGLYDTVHDPVKEKLVEQMDTQERLDELSRLDPDILSTSGDAGKIHPSDTYRVKRALTIVLSSGVPLSEHKKKSQGQLRKQVRGVFLDPPVEILKQRLLSRVKKMIHAGWVEEARKVREMYGDCAGLRTLGYPEILAYADGLVDEPTTIEAISRGHYQYARKQKMWFRRENLLTANDEKEAVIQILELLRQDFT
jgi:tRNA dimethylallyltransferase